MNLVKLQGRHPHILPRNILAQQGVSWAKGVTFRLKLRPECEEDNPDITAWSVDLVIRNAEGDEVTLPTDHVIDSLDIPTDTVISVRSVLNLLQRDSTNKWDVMNSLLQAVMIPVAVLIIRLANDDAFGLASSEIGILEEEELQEAVSDDEDYEEEGEVEDYEVVDEADFEDMEVFDLCLEITIGNVTLDVQVKDQDALKKFITVSE